MSLDISLHIEVDTGGPLPHYVSLYQGNITHNLAVMAREAGIYRALWHPEELRVETAADLVVLLEKGVELMRGDPERFRKYNADNGWGTYDQFLPMIEEYLEACKEHPHAVVFVHR